MPPSTSTPVPVPHQPGPPDEQSDRRPSAFRAHRTGMSALALGTALLAAPAVLAGTVNHHGGATTDSLVPALPVPRVAAATAPTATPRRVTAPTPRVVAAAVVVPTAPREIAWLQLAARGQVGQYGCLDALWERESTWQVGAANPASGAYGIPQALPGGKMAAAGQNWRTDANTQIRWGLDYIAGRYGGPCAAEAHSEATGWY